VRHESKLESDFIGVGREVIEKQVGMPWVYKKLFRSPAVERGAKRQL